jgi:hypothetical protein
MKKSIAKRKEIPTNFRPVVIIDLFLIACL